MPVASIDFYPTLLEIADVQPPMGQILDGVSLWPILAEEKNLAPRRLFWHFPSYVGKSPPSSAVRDGDFKLIQFFEDGGRFELYNLQSDPGEKSNLASSNFAMSKQLRNELVNWQTATGAALPQNSNPNFHPQAERPRGQPMRQNGRPQK